MRVEPTLVRFGPHETGWAIPDASGHWRIANIPFAEQYNLDDLVELTPSRRSGPRRIRRVLERPLPEKTYLYYPDMRAFQRLTAVVGEFGGKCEGFYRPSDGAPGLLAVAHTPALDPVEIAEGMGYPQG